MRRSATSSAFRYRLFVGMMILLLALLNPLACIIHCALAQVPHDDMYDHHGHKHAQMAHGAHGASDLHFFCDKHIASFATSETPAPLAPPAPQALYELVALPTMLLFLPAFLVVAGICFMIQSPDQWSTQPNPPPPRAA